MGRDVWRKAVILSLMISCLALALALGAIVLAQGTGDGQAERTPATAPAMPVVVGPPGTPAATPGTPVTPEGEAKSGRLEQAEKTAKSLDSLLSLAMKFGALVLSVILFVSYVWPMLNRLRTRPRELIIENLGNGSGDDVIGKMAPGLSLNARTQLYSHLNDAARRAGPALFPNEERYPLPFPRAQIDASYTDLIASLKEAAPEEVQGLVKMLAIAYPAHGTKVASILQRDGSTPIKLGITYEISPLSSLAQPEQRPHLRSLWESDFPRTIAGVRGAPTGAASGVSAGAAPTKADGLYLLGSMYDTRGDLDQAKVHYEAALKEDANHAAAQAGLARILSVRWSFSDRYSGLLEHSTQWLALHLIVQEFLHQLTQRAQNGEVGND